MATMALQRVELQGKTVESQLSKQLDVLREQVATQQASLEAKDKLIQQLNSQLTETIKFPAKVISTDEEAASPRASQLELLDRLHDLEVDNRRFRYENRLLRESNRIQSGID